jgi:hypothetical protein
MTETTLSHHTAAEALEAATQEIARLREALEQAYKELTVTPDACAQRQHGDVMCRRCGQVWPGKTA